ncbi:hypothetical protein ACF0H5_016647 [Mactra antiquata]
MMMRVKQIVMLSVLGVACTVLFVSFRATNTTNEIPQISDEGKVQLEKLVSKSIKFSKDVPEPNAKSKANTNVIIEDDNHILAVAKRISSRYRTVLVTMVNDAYLSFTYSWLCNTKNMDIHKSVLIITTDKVSKDNLTRDWPEISVVSMDWSTSHGDQTYSQVGYVKIMVKRTEMLLSMLMADIEIFLFEVDCLWLANPIPEFQKIEGYDILVNPVAGTGEKVYAGGFLYLFKTDKAKKLWKKVTEDMIALGEKISSKSDKTAVSEADNDQQYLSRLLNQKYADIKMKLLPLDVYADGQWYKLPEDKRNQSHPIVINNNWVVGNKAKIERAKKWKHWFIHDDLTCDMDLVKKVVYK